ncbi:hypothetical protein OA90_10335 [Labrenzia sp. OB1]|nr:hypothetical protein OA90_10335 [Labrenzia sp. OB1]
MPRASVMRERHSVSVLQWLWHGIHAAPFAPGPNLIFEDASDWIAGGGSRNEQANAMDLQFPEGRGARQG